MNPGIAALVAMAALFLGCSNAHEGDPRPDDAGAPRHAALGGISAQDALITKAALDYASTVSPDTMLDLVVVLRDSADFDFDFTRLQGKNDDEVAELIEERQAQLEPYVRELTKVVERLGGTIIAAYWSTPTLRVHLRARDLPQLAMHQMVRYVQLVTEGGQ